jgi:DNA-binding XRE family transcriptional regulator
VAIRTTVGTRLAPWPGTSRRYIGPRRWGAASTGRRRAGARRLIAAFSLAELAATPFPAGSGHLTTLDTPSTSTETCPDCGADVPLRCGLGLHPRVTPASCGPTGPRCPRCGTLASPRAGLGLPAYRLWRCERRECCALFDRQGQHSRPPRTEAERQSSNQVELGLRVRDARETKRWTQRDLAVVARVSRPYVSQVESGTANPSLVILIQLATALGVDPGELTRGLHTDCHP